MYKVYEIANSKKKKPNIYSNFKKFARTENFGSKERRHVQAMEGVW
jgi:hypothetical protein